MSVRPGVILIEVYSFLVLGVAVAALSHVLLRAVSPLVVVVAVRIVCEGRSCCLLVPERHLLR